jgi:flagellar basal-body rod protein FlgB
MTSRSIFPASVDVLAKSMAFLEERHRIISNNIANADTPFYKAKEAPLKEFQASLARALDAHRRNPSAPLTLKATDHVVDGPHGLVVTPAEASGTDAGVLRHDGNNVSLEKEMTGLAENAMLYRMMSDLLRKQFSSLQSAIRERVD